ncbi:metallophosphoesterase [Spirosoma arcticum]
MKTSLFFMITCLLLGREVSAQGSPQNLIASGDSWSFLDMGAAPSATNWTGSSPSPTGWRQGPSPLGYGNDGERTVVGYGPSPTNKYVTTYFHKTIAIPDTSGLFTLRYKRDDGIIIYVNGTEVKREYLPTGAVTNTTLATTVPEAEEPLWKTMTVPTRFFRPGTNVIAAEVHQASLTSSDMRFDLELFRTSALLISSASPTIERGPYLQMGTSTAMTLRWSTNVATEGRVVCQSPAGVVKASTWQPTQPLLLNDPSTPARTIHSDSVTVEGLDPDTPYSYTIQARQSANAPVFSLQGGPDNRFRTAPSTGALSGPQPLITSGDPSWWFLATGAAPRSSTWNGSGFFNDGDEDAGWQQGASPLGYGGDGERTLVSYGPSATTKFTTTYFRKTLLLTDPAGTFMLRYKRDDGIIIYVNGTEVKREYLPAGAVTNTTLATTVPEAEESLWKTISLPAGLWRAGANVIAAEVHQASLSSSDMRFDLELFRTAPSVSLTTRPIRIWALGDFGIIPTTGYNRHLKVRDAFTNYLSRNAIDHLDMWLWLGDNAYGWGTAQQYQKNVFDVYDSRLDPSQRIMKQTPIYATPGNHDYKDKSPTVPGLSQDPNDPLTRQTHKIHYYDVVNNYTKGDYSGVASGREEYYSYDYGNIHVVSLDTYGFECEKQPDGTYTCPNGYTILDTDPDPARNGEPRSAQVRWLKRDLEKAQQDSRIKWIIVITHYPFYSMGTKDSDKDVEIKPLREKFLRFLEQYKVDMVMTGHSHVYERSKPIRGQYGTESEYIADSLRFLAPSAPAIDAPGWYACSSASLANSMIYFKKSTDPANYPIHVVSGSGGAMGGKQIKNDPANPKAGWPHEVMQQSYDKGGSMYLEITGNRLDAKFITEDSEVGDHFTIIKDSDGFQIPVTNGTTHTPDCECTEGTKPAAAAYTHYVRRNPTGNPDLLLSIKKNGATIGKVGDGTFDLQLKGRPGATRIDAATEPADYVKASMMVMNRHWTLRATHELPPAAAASVRHYWNRSDYNEFTNIYYGPWQANYDYMFETIVINDDGGQTVRYERDPTIDRHRTIPKAPDYKATGAWIYKHGAVASSSTFKFGLPNPSFPRFQSSEFVVGRLRHTGGTIGGILSPYTSGNARLAAEGTANSDERTVSAYPNPTLDGKVFFSPAMPYQSYVLTDLQGNVLKQATTAGSLAELDLSALQTGLYVLVSRGEYGISRFKLIRN